MAVISWQGLAWGSDHTVTALFPPFFAGDFFAFPDDWGFSFCIKACIMMNIQKWTRRSVGGTTMTRSNARELAVHLVFELSFFDISADELLG